MIPASRFSGGAYELAANDQLTSVHRFVDSAALSQFPSRVAERTAVNAAAPFEFPDRDEAAARSVRRYRRR